MKRQISLPVLCLALSSLLLGLTACDSGGSGDGGEIQNEFSFTIEPTSSSSTEAVPRKGAQEEISGFSFFADSEDIEEANPSERSFLVYMSGENSFSQSSVADGLFGFIARNSGQPSEGTYDFVDGQNGPTKDEFVGWLYKDLSSSQSSPFYILRSGTINVETSNDNKFSGKLNGTATEFSFSSTGFTREEVKITGSFTAKNAEGWIDAFQYTNTP